MSECTIVQLLTHHGSNCPGDVCGFAPEEAGRLVALGAAKLVKGRAPAPVIAEPEVADDKPKKSHWVETEGGAAEEDETPAAPPAGAAKGLPKEWLAGAPKAPAKK
jgi:hypothetical protein